MLKNKSFFSRFGGCFFGIGKKEPVSIGHVPLQCLIKLSKAVCRKNQHRRHSISKGGLAQNRIRPLLDQ